MSAQSILDRLKNSRDLTALPPMSEEEREGVVARALGGTMSGIQWLGESLDKPGRALRGTLAGRPYELLNLLPFSDTVGITDPTQSVGGRDLLETWGLLKKNRPGLDAGDVFGFVTEFVLDPLLPLSFFGGSIAKGALTGAKLGESATKILTPLKWLKGGSLTEAAAAGADMYDKLGKYVRGIPVHTREALETGARGLMGIHKPEFKSFTVGGLEIPYIGFERNPSYILGTGPIAGKIHEWWTYRNPIVRAWRALRQPHLDNKLVPIEQALRDQTKARVVENEQFQAKLVSKAAALRNVIAKTYPGADVDALLTALTEDSYAMLMPKTPGVNQSAGEFGADLYHTWNTDLLSPTTGVPVMSETGASIKIGEAVHDVMKRLGLRDDFWSGRSPDHERYFMGAIAKWIKKQQDLGIDFNDTIDQTVAVSKFAETAAENTFRRTGMAPPRTLEAINSIPDSIQRIAPEYQAMFGPRAELHIKTPTGVKQVPVSQLVDEYAPLDPLLRKELRPTESLPQYVVFQDMVDDKLYNDARVKSGRVMDVGAPEQTPRGAEASFVDETGAVVEYTPVDVGLKKVYRVAKLVADPSIADDAAAIQFPITTEIDEVFLTADEAKDHMADLMLNNLKDYNLDRSPIPTLKGIGGSPKAHRKIIEFVSQIVQPGRVPDTNSVREMRKVIGEKLKPSRAVREAMKDSPVDMPEVQWNYDGSVRLPVGGNNELLQSLIDSGVAHTNPNIESLIPEAAVDGFRITRNTRGEWVVENILDEARIKSLPRDLADEYAAERRKWQSIVDHRQKVSQRQVPSELYIARQYLQKLKDGAKLDKSGAGKQTFDKFLDNLLDLVGPRLSNDGVSFVPDESLAKTIRGVGEEYQLPALKAAVPDKTLTIPWDQLPEDLLRKLSEEYHTDLSLAYPLLHARQSQPYQGLGWVRLDPERGAQIQLKARAGAPGQPMSLLNFLPIQAIHFISRIRGDVYQQFKTAAEKLGLPQNLHDLKNLDGINTWATQFHRWIRDLPQQAQVALPESDTIAQLGELIGRLDEEKLFRGVGDAAPSPRQVTETIVNQQAYDEARQAWRLSEPEPAGFTERYVLTKADGSEKVVENVNQEAFDAAYNEWRSAEPQVESFTRQQTKTEVLPAAAQHGAITGRLDPEAAKLFNLIFFDNGEIPNPIYKDLVPLMRDPEAAKLSSITTAMYNFSKAMHDAAGLNIENTVEKYGGYATRSMNPHAVSEFIDDEDGIRKINEFLKEFFAKHRKAEYTDIPGTTYGLNQITMDPKVVGTEVIKQNPKMYEHIRSIDDDPINGVIFDTSRAAAYLSKKYGVAPGKARALARALSYLPRKLAKVPGQSPGIPLFDDDYINITAKYMAHSQEVVNTAMATRHLLAEGLRMFNRPEEAPLFSEAFAPLALLDRAGYSFKRGTELLTGNEISRRLGVKAESLGEYGTDITNLFLSKHHSNPVLRRIMESKGKKIDVKSTMLETDISRSPINPDIGLMDWIKHPLKTFERSDTVQTIIRGGARSRPEPYVTLEQVWKDAQWKEESLGDFIASLKNTPLEGGLDARGITKDSKVPRFIANIIQNTMQGAVDVQLQDDFSKGFLKIWDKIRALTGVHLTSPMPMFMAFHTKNAAGGQWANLMTLGTKAFGVGISKLWTMITKDNEESRQLWETITAAGLTNPDAKAVAYFGKSGSELSTPRSWKQFVFEPVSTVFKDSDILGRGGAPGRWLKEQIQDTHVGTGELAQAKLYDAQRAAAAPSVKGISKNLMTWFRMIADPTAVRGFRGSRRPTLWLPAMMGDVMYNFTELMNRAVHLFGQVHGNGMSLEAASRMVKEVHFDYSAMGSIEKKVLKRLIPFYGWLRNNLPFTVMQVLSQPGGGHAQTIRALNSTQKPDERGGWVPSWLRESWSMPLGVKQDGTKIYLSGNPFPLDELSNFHFPAHLNLNDSLEAIRQTLDRNAASLHPLIKYLLELMSGRELHTGRQLENVPGKLITRLTGLKSLERMAMATPAARYLNVAHYTFNQPNLTANQKFWNWFTTMKSRELSPDDVVLHQRADLQRHLEREAVGSPYIRMFKSPYVLKEDLPLISDDQRNALSAFRSLQSEIGRRP